MAVLRSMVCSPISAAVSACAEASATINCMASRSATRKPRDRRSRVNSTNSATARSARPTIDRAQREQRQHIARRAIERIVGVDGRARCGAVLEFVHADRAVAGTTTSLTTSDLLPVPHSPMTSQSSTISTSLDRQEKHPRFRRAGAFHHRVEQNPLRMIAAAGEAPAATQPMTAGHGLRRAVRRDSSPTRPRGDRRPTSRAARVPENGRPPNCARRARRRPRPTSRSPAPARGPFSRTRDSRSRSRRTSGLQAAGNPKAAEIVDGLLWPAALGGGLPGALAQDGNERASARSMRISARSVDVLRQSRRSWIRMTRQPIHVMPVAAIEESRSVR